jgi:hypothetical protein
VPVLQGIHSVTVIEIQDLNAVCVYRDVNSGPPSKLLLVTVVDIQTRNRRLSHS